MKHFHVRHIAVLLLAATLTSQCGQPAPKPTATTKRGAAGAAGVGSDTSDSSTGGSSGGGTAAPGSTTPATNSPTPEQTAKSQTFFVNNVLPLFRGTPCSDCHAAPRELRDPNVNGGLSVREHSAMFAMLRDGPGANDNRLIKKLLNVIPHEGGRRCTDENAEPCGTVKRWYREVFGEGTLMLGRIANINREGIVSGWAGSADAPTATLEVRLFIDGDKTTGRALPVTLANLEAADNDIPGPHAFSVRIPADMIDGRPKKMWAYTTHNGKEVMLAGSPFDYTAFKPKGQAVATAFAQTGLQSCNGACHTFNYENRWGTLLGNGPNNTWTATSNAAYQKLSGALGHGGPALPGNINLQAVSQWWTQEFATP